MSRCGDSVPHLARQLSYLHAQILSILTAKVEAIFLKNAAFDLRGLLGGTDRVLRALIAAGSGDAAMLLGATPTLRTPPAARAELGKLLGAARPPELLFGLLLAHGQLLQLLRPKKVPLHAGRDVLRPFLPRSSDSHIPIPTSRRQVPLHADDVLLVVNTVTSSAAFREDESWLPLCLPRFNPKGFLYAHVSFVAPEVCLVLLTAQADGFPQLSACRQQLAAKLQQEGAAARALLRAVGEPRALRRAAPQTRAARAPARRPRAARAHPARRLPPQVHVDAPGVPEVRHFVYRVGEQFTARARRGARRGAVNVPRPRGGEAADAPLPERPRARPRAAEACCASTCRSPTARRSSRGRAPSTSSTSPSARSRASPSPSRRPTGCSAGSRRSSRACSSCTPSR